MPIRRGAYLIERRQDQLAVVPPDSGDSPPSSHDRSVIEAALAQADALYRLARHLVGKGAQNEAEDLVQETYERALGARDHFVPGTNVRAWLFRILRNAHIDQCRRRRTNPVTLADPAQLDEASTPDEPLRGDRELDQLRRVVAEDIEAALATLTADARTIVLLDHEGFTETELAEVLGCALGTVKSRLARARAALRVRLSDYARE